MTRAAGGSPATRVWQFPQFPESTSRHVGLETKVNPSGNRLDSEWDMRFFNYFHALAWGVLLHSTRISWPGPSDEHFSVSTQRCRPDLWVRDFVTGCPSADFCFGGGIRARCRTYFPRGVILFFPNHLVVLGPRFEETAPHVLRSSSSSSSSPSSLLPSLPLPSAYVS